MRWITLTLPLAGLAMLGCTSAGAQPTPTLKLPTASYNTTTTTQSQNSIAQPQTSAATPAIANGANLRSCYEGRCEIVVSSPVRFRIDPRFGVNTVSVELIGPSTVAVSATGPGVSLRMVQGPGGIGTLDNLAVRVVTASAGRAVVRFSPL